MLELTIPGERIELLGIRINDLPVEALIDEVIVEAIRKQTKAIVANVNIHAMNLAYEREWMRRFLNDAEIVFCDGFGVKWGARLMGHKIQHRYTPPDWIDLLGQRCEASGFSLFFLGARPGVAEQAAARLKASYPTLRIDTHHGHFDKQRDGAENAQVVQRINALRPNILIMGLGMPLQEQWLTENWDALDANVAITAGALFDYMAGTVYRAPRWMTDRGLEWLARLVIEPHRLWRRYLIGNPVFLARVIRERLRGSGVGEA